LKGFALGPDLQIGRGGVDGITGATLTTRAAVDAARRALALHQTSGEGRKAE
jgi:Na+-translocating ferredoxin:NAD+ oxidoreductase RnfG subunit